MAEAKTSKPKRSLASLILLPAILILVPVGGWFGLDIFMKKKTGAKAPAKQEENEHKKKTVHSLSVPNRLPMPIAESPLVFLRADPSKDIPPRIITTNAFKAGSLRPDEIVIRFADVKKKHHAVIQLRVAGDDTEELLRKMNDHQAVLFENITNLLSGKFYKETKAPGFRSILRSEVAGLVNHLLGSNLVQEVIIPKFITQ